MKIAIPVDENRVETSVCISFGRTPYFMLYDTLTKANEFLNNEAAASQGGAGIKAAQGLVDKQVDVLLTPRCGDNAAEVLNAAGVKMYKTKEGSAMDNINASINGELSLLAETHAGLHNHGGK